MASPSIPQEPQDDWLTLTLSASSSSSPPKSQSPPPHPPHFQYIPPPPPPSPASPNHSSFNYIPLPPPPPFMYPPHNQKPHFLAPLPYPSFDFPPNPPSQEPSLLPIDESPLQESSFGEAQTPPRRARASSPNPPPRAVRRRRDVGNETIPPPFPWATSKRAIIHDLDHLRSQGVTAITGTVTCKRCDEQYEITFNLEEKFNKLAQFIEENKFDMHDRAPACWSNPVLPMCERCGAENSLKPVITKKRSINWLFLLLGQMVGCCKLEQLKYFCKHAMNHRTGAKDRLLYSVYLGLCKQLHHQGPY